MLFGSKENGSKLGVDTLALDIRAKNIPPILD